MFRRALLAAWLAAFAAVGLAGGAVHAEGTIDGRGNVVKAAVNGRVDPYSPTEWLMRLDVQAQNALGQPIANAPVTFERLCRSAVPCPFRGVPENVGTTDASGRLTFAWTERKVTPNSNTVIEAVAHVYIAPEWVDVGLFYSIGVHEPGGNGGVDFR